MKVAVVQHDIVWEDRDANYRHLSPKIASAAEMGARVVVLTEMFPSGFTMDVSAVAEPFDGPSHEFLRVEADKHDIWVCGSAPEIPENAQKPANTALLVGPGGITHRYRKIHPFTYDGEHEVFEAGSEFTTVEIDGVRFTLFICYDLRFADEFWVTAHATDCYIVPANWPSTRVAHWEALLRARAVENQAYVVGANRVGKGGAPKFLEYSGSSRIIDPLGELVASATDGESILTAEVDPGEVARVRATFPFLNDRR